MKYFIRNMVCDRCIMVVKQVFEELGYLPVRIVLGEVETGSPIDNAKLELLRGKLTSFGFELIDDAKSQLIGKIKTLVIEVVHYRKNDELKINYSAYIESNLNKDYNYLSNLFSEVTGTTIEKYIINQKIERVKELLVYDELTLSQIAWELGYSSVSALSAQFKKVTGLTPKHFRQIKDNKRTPLDKV
ncbi:MAG: AraC family transcriptional regulator [Bacteroidetes bacterium GWF2_42_66]|nr:MAG: AraC family transcriptional regulator [Bacteroidetes bacterium GWA2_42_15]OFY01876.1 MAG: AraC family transcriptional regulator [Bacteroidetes bacterium GWE2_42_39]OFY44828.1 MAG: AraC family transcriptional regulator [Bacteroidetes bacterium GWF2_42_66]HBL75954.1 AraC family transcriptional regulator [Prolixibacteraceae bacterium]HCR89761.1 AraC family transcriptional regulator [Prolixibacteraceae bacterium]